VVEATIDTGYLDKHLAEVMPQARELPQDVLVAVALRALIDEEAASEARARTGSDPHSPWAVADGWRHGHPGKRLKYLVYRDTLIEVAAHGYAGDYSIDVGVSHLSVRGARAGAESVDFLLDGRAVRLRVLPLPNGYLAHDGERRYLLTQRHPFAFEGKRAGSGDSVRAPMPGRVVAVRVDADATVAEGQEVIVMEAMKMELTLRAPRAGVVAEIRASVGEFVEADSVLVRLVEEGKS
jgi:3-methylcrotonyl-CoA carboxylase alpha subunit